MALSVTFEAAPGEVVGVFTMPEAMTLPATAPGSAGRADRAPAGIHRVLIYRGATQVGTISWSPTSVLADIQVTANQVFGAKDLLKFVVSDTLAASGFVNYSATLRFLLQNNG